MEVQDTFPAVYAFPSGAHWRGKLVRSRFAPKREPLWRSRTLSLRFTLCPLERTGADSSYALPSRRNVNHCGGPGHFPCGLRSLLWSALARLARTFRFALVREPLEKFLL